MKRIDNQGIERIVIVSGTISKRTTNVQSRGLDITVADMSVFAAVHEIVDETNHAALERVPHVQR